SDARRAELEYVTSERAGFTRHRWGRGFTYRDDAGRTVRSRALRQRFDGLAIPPAWTNVWICGSDRGHKQATGRDAADRKQYIYHPRFITARREAKYRRVAAFGALLPRVRRAVARDLKAPRGEARCALAAIVRLLKSTRARVGHLAYAQAHGSYGLTTLQRRHARLLDDGAVELEFTGKRGQPWRLRVEDEQVQRALRLEATAPDAPLFAYDGGDGAPHRVTADEVNAYLRRVSGQRILAKDFRTWAACVLAVSRLGEAERRGRLEHDADVAVRDAVAAVAQALNNTPPVCRSAYISPRLLETSRVSSYRLGAQERVAGDGTKRLHGAEVKTLALLRAAYPFVGRRAAQPRRAA
ncbi:MAG: DNA topoisomerase IB, partial [Myxococcota bacterium]